MANNKNNTPPPTAQQQRNEELITRFTLYMRSERAARDNTIENYIRDLRKLGEWLSHPLSEATRADLQTYSSSTIAGGKSGSTAARHLCCFRSFYHFLMDEDVIATDPTLNLRSPKSWKKIPEAQSAFDVDRMVASLGNSTLEIRDKAMLLLFFGSGLRADELAALKVEDVDLDTEIVKIWDGKGGKDARLPLSYFSIKAIEHYLRESRPKLAEFAIRSRGYVATPYLFLGQRCGNRMTRQQVFYRIRDIAKAVLGKDASPINLRHGYCTALIDGGADLRDVQVLMRHAYISTTERYIHTDINYIRGFYAKHPRAAAAGNGDSTISDVLQGKKPQPEHDTRLPLGFGATHGNYRG
jgi:integrase/recombinase XerD